MTAEVSQKKYSVEEFMALLTDGSLYELIEGELVELPLPTDLHGRLISKLSRKLGNFVEEHKLGEVWTTTGFNLTEKTVRAPYVAFLTASRVPSVSEKAIPVPPDLAVEVISPSDIWNKVYDKIEEYQQAGVRLIWVIFPRGSFVQVYRLGSPYPTTYNPDDELDGEQVVPVFKIKVSALFDYGA